MSTSEPGQDPQNIYDNSAFFAAYKALRQNDSGLNGAIEIPALRSVLPALSGRSILDLGCGFGDFARYARQAGAASVIAVDVSTRMLDEAARQTDDRAILYRRSSIELYVPEAQSLDVVVSSLALHYVPDYATVVQRVYAALKPGGWFVFSVEHPACTANSVGWVRDAAGESVHWPLDHYQEEGRRATTWFVDGVIKYHRTVATYVNTLIYAGFRIQMLSEPTPSAEAVSLRPALLAENRRPPFLVLAAIRP
ncbi:MAG: class I SAM-dependent methyltransferase [Steroidobacteraceae bacterium]